MRCPRDQARTDSARNPSGPSQVGQGSSSANQIPLVVLQQSFVQNSCTESSNLSSSQSPSTTPPSSAGRPSSQEEELGAWPSSANCNLGATPPEPSPPFSTTDRRAETAPITFAPESVPSEDDGNQPTQASQEQHSSAGPGISWSTLNRWVSERSWFHSTLGITSLMLTTISVFVYGLRSYEMARWSERNDLLQMCAGLIQANVTGGPDCERVLREGPTLPPYSHRQKRYFHQAFYKNAMLYNPGVGAYNLSKRVTNSFYTPVDWTGQTELERGVDGIRNWALAVVSALAVAAGVLALLRSRPTDEVVFTSPAKSEGTVKVTRYYPEGPETTEHEHPMQITRRKPPEDQGSEEVRRRILQDQIREKDGIPAIGGGMPWIATSNNNSEDTLVATWTESNSRRVSIATSSDEGLHEGLIELRPTGHTKNFLDPDTGASYHLSPWKSTHDDADEESLKSKPKDVGTVKSTIVKMSVGGAALASGKVIEDQIGEALEKKERIPQQAGDCLAGEVTNKIS